MSNPSPHDLLSILFQAHPWHGVSARGADATVNAYIEVVPSDTVKYELDKVSGHLKVDRPQRFSSQCPMLYGFIPQTYCGAASGALAQAASGRAVDFGDEDPLDVCVLSERVFAQGAFFLRARPIGGIRLLDKGRADDKLIAVLEADGAYGHFRDLGDCPVPIVDRLKHYFLSYKREPGTEASPIELAGTYGAAEAERVLAASEADYRATFGDPANRRRALEGALGGR